MELVFNWREELVRNDSGESDVIGFAFLGLYIMGDLMFGDMFL